MSGTSMSSRMGEQHQPQQTSVFAKMQGMGTGMHGGMGNMGSNMGAMGGSMGMARKMGKGGMGGMNNMNSMNNMGGGMMNSGMGGMGGGMGGGMCGQGMQGMGGMGMAQGNEKGKMGSGGMCGMTMGAMGQKGMGKPMGCKGDSNGCGAQGTLAASSFFDASAAYRWQHGPAATGDDAKSILLRRCANAKALVGDGFNCGGPMLLRLIPVAAVQSDFNLPLLRTHREPMTSLDSISSRCPMLSEGTTPAQRMQMQQAQQQERLMQAPSQAFQQKEGAS
ncbi:unnamed protein product [Symbiodinium sp. CCMP2592]|nr:unnamed protein product [Symbiodinium sp. CCMP2592]